MIDLQLGDSDVEYLLSVLDEYPQDSHEYEIRETILDQLSEA